MQEKLIKFFEFITNVMVIFSVTIIITALLGFFLGEEVKYYSNMFSLGSSGIALSTIFQFLLSSVIVVILNILFMSNIIFKKMMMLWRTSFLLLSIIIVIVIFIICFNWFPVDFLPAWIGFFITFGGCFVISTLVMIIKTKHENKQYEELLKSYKNQKTEGDINNEND